MNPFIMTFGMGFWVAIQSTAISTLDGEAAVDTLPSAEAVAIVGWRALAPDAPDEELLRWTPPPPPNADQEQLRRIFGPEFDEPGRVANGEADSVMWFYGEVWGNDEAFAAQWCTDLATMPADFDVQGEQITYPPPTSVAGRNARFGWTGASNSGIYTLSTSVQDVPGFWPRVDVGRLLYGISNDPAASVARLEQTRGIASKFRVHQADDGETVTAVWSFDGDSSRRSSAMLAATFPQDDALGMPQTWRYVVRVQVNGVSRSLIYHVRVLPRLRDRPLALAIDDLLIVHHDVEGIESRGTQDFAQFVSRSKPRAE